MSKVVKGIGKVFKKVVKVIKKVAPIVLAVGALVFTAGAALGFAPLAGGWSAAVSTVTAKLGTGVLGSAITGGITQAGYGAIIGGGISAATGGSFSKGAQAGAVTGLVTGGVSGALNASKAAALTTPGQTPPTAPGGGAKTFPLGSTPPGPQTPIDAAGNASGPTTTTVASVQPPSVQPKGLMSTVKSAASKTGKFIKDNPVIVGSAITGLGNAMGASSEQDAERAFVRERFGQVRANYAGTDPGAGYRGLAPGTSGQTPTERYDPRNFGSFEYQYDAKQGRIIKVPVGEG